MYVFYFWIFFRRIPAIVALITLSTTVKKWVWYAAITDTPYKLVPSVLSPFINIQYLIFLLTVHVELLHLTTASVWRHIVMIYDVRRKRLQTYKLQYYTHDVVLNKWQVVILLSKNIVYTIIIKIWLQKML